MLGTIYTISPIDQLEKNIRGVFSDDPNITFEQGVELINITEDSDTVTITYKFDSGKATTANVSTSISLF
jgi:2-polyprenyl-6-methoxyphenol hydroxylase-like FAD-dependent oxidoreductase